MLQIFGIIAGLLAVICHIPYLIDIFKGTTKPERASWLIWSVLGTVAFFSQLAKGATDSLWLNGLDTLGSTVTFILAIKFGMGGLAKRDIASIIFAIGGMALWFVTKEPMVALIIVVLVDFAGSILTIIKAYETPETETLSTWIILFFSGMLAAVSVGELNFSLLLYPMYIGLINGATGVAILLGRRKAHGRINKN